MVPLLMPLLLGASLLAALPHSASALDNGVAALPPMGWSSWNSLGGNYNETTIMAQADAMVSSGMRDAGYVYINIDDLWASKQRSVNGSLVPDQAKFPSGFHALSAYIHSKSLKFGLYSDVGTTTCGGQPGSFEHECADAKQFQDWVSPVVRKRE